MILYHGSYKKFNKFEISEVLSIHDSQTVLPEGIGIYMIDDKEFTKSYGNFIYKVEIKENNIFDATNKKEIKNKIDELNSSIIGVNIYNYLTKNNLEDVLHGVLRGNLSIVRLGREISLLLDSKEEFWSDNEDNAQEILDAIEELWECFMQEVVIRYYDKSFDRDIFISKNADLLNIINIDKI